MRCDELARGPGIQNMIFVSTAVLRLLLRFALALMLQIDAARTVLMLLLLLSVV